MFQGRQAAAVATQAGSRFGSRTRRAIPALLVSLTAAAAMGYNAAPVGATSYSFCVGSILTAFGHCDGARHSLTASQAYDDFGVNGVCAGAVDTNGNFYGSYACGNGFAEHCYSGLNLLYPRIHNSEAYSQQMHGTGFYSEQCP